MVGVNADVGGDGEAFVDDFVGGEVGSVFFEGEGGGLGVHGSGADGAYFVVGFDDVAVAGEEEEFVFVDGDEHGFEASEEAVHAPVFGEFNGGAFHISAVAVEFFVKALEEREGVGGGAGETCEYFAILQLTDFAYVAFCYIVSHCRLAVTADGYVAVVFNGEDGGCVYFFHGP